MRTTEPRGDSPAVNRRQLPQLPLRAVSWSCGPNRRSTKDGGDTVRLEIRTERVRFLVSKAPEPRSDLDGRQKVDRASGESLYTTELVAMDDAGAEVVKVTTAGAPKVGPDQ